MLTKSELFETAFPSIKNWLPVTICGKLPASNWASGKFWRRPPFCRKTDKTEFLYEVTLGVRERLWRTFEGTWGNGWPRWYRAVFWTWSLEDPRTGSWSQSTGSRRSSLQPLSTLLCPTSSVKHTGTLPTASRRTDHQVRLICASSASMKWFWAQVLHLPIR